MSRIGPRRALITSIRRRAILRLSVRDGIQELWRLVEIRPSVVSGSAVGSGENAEEAMFSFKVEAGTVNG